MKIPLRYDFSLGYYVEETMVATESTANPAFKDAFDKHFKNVTFDSRFLNKLRAYNQDIFGRPNNLEWFGSTLLGVHPIRYLPQDSDRFFDEICEVDEDALTESIRSTKSVNLEWNVGGSVLNLAIVYIVHRVLAKADKDPVAHDIGFQALMLMQFKFYSSIYFNFFSKRGRLVDLPTAEAAYAALSMRFEIKVAGSWRKHLENRAEDFLSKDGTTHHPRIVKFDNPKDVIYYITDMNTRNKNTVKEYYDELRKVRQSGNRILVQSQTIILDGQAIMRDQVNALSIAKQQLFESSVSFQSLYKAELALVVLEMVPKASGTAFKNVLQYIAKLPSLGKERDKINVIMEDTLAHAFDYVVTNRVSFTDVASLLEKLRALYTAPKSSNQYVLSLRDSIEKIVSKETHLTHQAALAAVRTALMLYFVLRAIAGTR